MTDFQFNPAAVNPQTPVEVVPSPQNAGVTKKTPVVSDVERIRAARERGIAMSKTVNAGEYSFHRDAGFWTDYAGENSSAYDAGNLIVLLGLLDVQGLSSAVFLKAAGSVVAFDTFDRRAGAWKRGEQSATIQEVRAVVDARIEELGLSKALLFEYLAEPHSWQERQALRSLDFQTRMDRFRGAL